MAKIRQGKIMAILLITASFGFSLVASAATPDELLKGYAVEAKKANKGFVGFKADHGEKFYMAERKNKKGQTASCSGCHSKDPTAVGKTRANKAIEPMAVSANKKRFTDKAKVEKWFKRNCEDVYDRPCTIQEKGDFISFLKSR